MGRLNSKLERNKDTVSDLKSRSEEITHNTAERERERRVGIINEKLNKY